jgi:hypothetical protein
VSVPFDNLIQSLPLIRVEQWTGVENWPVFRVYFHAAHYSEDGERYAKRERRAEAEARANATPLSKRTGWHVVDHGALVEGQR